PTPELPAAPLLGRAVDGDRPAREQVLRLRAGADEAGQLEQLAEADHLAADRDLAHQTGVASPTATCTASSAGLSPPPMIAPTRASSAARWSAGSDAIQLGEEM